MPSLEDRCSLRSRAVAEPLAGTASAIRRWLLVTHAGPWGVDGLRDARLPEGVGAALADLGTRTGARVLLIRRTAANPAGAGVRCFAVDTREGWIGHRSLARLEEAATMDPTDPGAFETVAGPLVVVCTHGRRDVCCAERGRPVAEALAAVAPEAVWESTHVGGDRFAANIVAFPHGLVFGRIDPAETATLASGLRAGRVAPLDRFRGRTRDPFDVQAADAAVRAASGLDGIDDLVLVERTLAEDRSAVTFATPAGRYRVTLRRTDGSPMRLTCRSAAEETPSVWRPDVPVPVER